MIIERKYHNILCEHINKLLLNEKFGVADELDTLIQTTGREILKNIQNAKMCYDKADDIYYKKYTQYIDFCDRKNFPIKTTLLIYNDFVKCMNAMESGLQGAYITLDNGIDIFAYEIEGEIFESDFFDTLGHEMEHAYQDLKSEITSRQQLKNLMKPCAYDVAKKYMENSSNPYKYHISRCVYAGEAKEQDALLNGMFQFFRMNTFNEKAFTSINSSPATIWLENFYESYSFIRKNYNKNEMKEAFREFKPYYKDFNTFVRKSRNALRRYERKYSRTVYYIKMRLFRWYHPKKPLQLENYLKIK